MKERYSATHTEARYVGNHPHIAGTTGVYYWNMKEHAFTFRPNSEDAAKTDWYRVLKENLVDLKPTGK